MRFKPARLDTCSCVVTVVTTVLLVAMAVFLAFRMPSPSGGIAAGVLLAIVIGCYLWSAKEYRREGDALVIEKMAGARTVIPFRDIEHAFIVDDFAAWKPMRTFGNGGLFGYYGIFSTAEHGHISCHLTRLKRIVMIRARDRLFAVSPEDERGFLAMVTAAAPAADQRPETMPAIRPEARRYASPLILLVPDMILALTLVLAAAIYPKLPPVIATHFDGQGMANGWSTKQSFLVMGIVPCVVMFGLNVLIFFTIRRRVPDPRITYSITGLFSLMQLLFAYILLDIYSFNVRDRHLLPLSLLMGIFFGLVAAGFFLYYRMVRRPH